jgi:hypothetical protein
VDGGARAPRSRPHEWQPHPPRPQHAPPEDGEGGEEPAPTANAESSLSTATPWHSGQVGESDQARRYASNLLSQAWHRYS